MFVEFADRKYVLARFVLICLSSAFGGKMTNTWKSLSVGIRALCFLATRSHAAENRAFCEKLRFSVIAPGHITPLKPSEMVR